VTEINAECRDKDFESANSCSIAREDRLSDEGKGQPFY
jgi:hypothetical protein